MSELFDLADGHVHSEWSWDAARGDMLASCARAVEIGLPAIAFTEHADFVQLHEGQRALDAAGYLEAVERCRVAFPGLVVWSGVELGEPHRFPDQVVSVLAAGAFDRVLGSVHAVQRGGALHDMSQPAAWDGDPLEAARGYLEETLELVESPAPFAALAHLDYFKRYWPRDQPTFHEEDLEEEYRAVLRALAARGGALEVNTSRGAEPHRGLCPGATVLRWWRELGGRAVSFGSDSHEPGRIAAGFELASQVVEAAGFRPSSRPDRFWTA